MKKVKIYAFILSCAIMLFTACSGNNTEKMTGQKTPDESLTDTVTEESIDIPVTNMKGKEFNIFASGWYGYEPLAIIDIFQEEIIGEPLNDAAYERRMKIEDAYNCKIIQSGIDIPQDALSKFQMTIQAQDDSYDIGIIRGLNFAKLLTGGYLRELGDLQNINFDNPWWREKASEAYALGGKKYGICGDVTTNEMLAVLIVCFNKGIVSDYDLKSPYELVKAGDWTLDKAVGMAKTAAHDLDNDGIMTGSDFWGMLYSHDEISGLLNACGIRLAELDHDGIPQITFDLPENISKIQNIFNKIYDETYSGNTTVRVTGGGNIFGENRSLFSFTSTHVANGLRQMDVDLGIIPYPKYDIAQPEYLPTVVGSFLPVICIPSTNNDMENTGLFLEAFACEGKKSVIPVFYDNILKGKVTRDEESEDMIDYIFGNIYYDTGNLLNFGDMAVQINLMSVTLNDNIASFAVKNRPVYEKAINDIMDEIKTGQ